MSEPTTSPNEEAPEHEHLPEAFERDIPLVPLLAVILLAGIFGIWVFIL